MDLYLTEDGDLARGASGDIATTPNPWRDDVQAAYVRVKTEQGDYLLYPNLGASLSQLYGMPQSPSTGRLGERLIAQALEREGRFLNHSFSIKAVPVDLHKIRFDVDIKSGSRNAIRMSIEQNLGFLPEEEEEF